MAKKSAPSPKKKTAAAPRATPSTVESPPVPGAPSPAPGFEPLTRLTAARLHKPGPAQVASGSAVAAEVTGSKTYTKDFSASAPSASGFAQALDVAEAWSTEEHNAEQWAACASTSKQVAWDAVLAIAAKLKPEYAYALSHDPTIASRYPELTRFLGAGHAQAAKAAQTRKKNEKAAARAKKSTT